MGEGDKYGVLFFRYFLSVLRRQQGKHSLTYFVGFSTLSPLLPGNKKPEGEAGPQRGVAAVSARDVQLWNCCFHIVESLSPPEDFRVESWALKSAFWFLATGAEAERYIIRAVCPPLLWKSSSIPSHAVRATRN